MCHLAVVLWLGAIACHDARTRRIPNAMVWPGLVAVVASTATIPTVGVAALVAATPYVLCHLLGWCGGGDVKLAAVCGGLLSMPDVALVMVAAASLGSAAALICARRSGSMPHAPFLVAATLMLSGVI